MSSPIRAEVARHLGRSVGLIHWIIYPILIVVSTFATDLVPGHHPQLLVSLVCSLVVGLPRYLVSRRLTRAPDEDLPRLVFLYQICVYLVAIQWSLHAISVMSWRVDAVTAYMMASVTAGILAGSVTGLNAHLPTQMGYLLLMTMPQGVYLFLQPGSDRLTGLLVFLFAFFMGRAALVNHRHFISWLEANRALGEALAHTRLLEERWSFAFQGSGDGVWDWDLASERLSLSPRMREMLGLGEGNESLSQCLERITDEDREGVRQSLEAHIAGQTALFASECRVMQEQDRLVWMQLRGKVTSRDQHGRPLRVVGTCTDIDEQKNLQIQLNLSRNLESVGQLAAGIAHEMNTPIQYISDNVTFLKDACGEMLEAFESGQPLEDLDYLSGEVPQCLDQTAQGLVHISKIIRAMREFTHTGRGDLRPTNLNHLIENSLTLCHNKLKYISAVDTLLEPDLPEILADQSQLSQVFLNLLVNAADAVAQRQQGEPSLAGSIHVETRRVGPCLEALVRDNGCGILATQKGKVFEPFFTTKELGKGTGQGLTLCRSIMERHGGQIAFITEPGRGTTFSVTLPLKLSA